MNTSTMMMLIHIKFTKNLLKILYIF